MKWVDEIKVNSEESKWVAMLSLTVVLRGVLNNVLFNWTLLSVIADSLYVCLFYLNTAGGLLFFFRYSIKKNPSAFFFSHKYYWFFIFVSVPIVTYLSGNNFYLSSDYLKNITAEQTGRNYLPEGLVFSVPLLAVFFIEKAINYFNVGLLNLILAFSVIALLNYVIYYQWIFYAAHFSTVHFSYQVGISVYGTLALAASFPLFNFSFKILKPEKKWIKAYLLALYFFIFLGLTKVVEYLF